MGILRPLLRNIQKQKLTHGTNLQTHEENGQLID